MAQQTIGTSSSAEEEGGGGSKSSWAQIVAASSSQVNTKLEYYEPLLINGKQIVAPPEEVRLEGSSYWQNCLVGQFVGQRPAFPVVRSIAKSLGI